MPRTLDRLRDRPGVSTGIESTIVKTPTVQRPDRKAVTYTGSPPIVPVRNKTGPLAAPITSTKGFFKPSLSENAPMTIAENRKPAGKMEATYEAEKAFRPCACRTLGNQPSRVS